MTDNLGARMRNLEVQVGEIKVEQQNHCEENNAHFARIEKTQDVIVTKIDNFRDITSTKADRAEVTALENNKANKDDLKELRNWVVGGILISILLMVLSIIVKK